VIVLARARGDVRIGYEVAMALPAPLDLFLVRRLGVPRPRGAGDGGVGQLVVVVNDDLVRGIDIPAEVIERVAKREPRSRLDANAFTGRSVRCPISPARS